MPQGDYELIALPLKLVHASHGKAARAEPVELVAMQVVGLGLRDGSGVPERVRSSRAEPFGGVQLVLFGDPYQLAPVPGEGDEPVGVDDPMTTRDALTDDAIRPDEYARVLTYRVELLTHHAATLD